MDGVLEGGTDGGGVGYKWYGDRNGRPIKWYDAVSNTTLGTEPHSFLAYSLLLELRHPIMSTIGVRGGLLERNI